MSDHDHCYECGGELQITTDTTLLVEVPNPDYDPTKPKPEPFAVNYVYGAKTVTFPKGTPDD